MLSMAVQSVRVPTKPDIWLVMELNGQLSVLASPHLLIDTLQGFIPLITELTTRDIDVLYGIAVSPNGCKV